MSRWGVLLFSAIPVVLVVGFLGLRGGFSAQGIVSGLTSLSPDQFGSFLSGTFGAAAFAIVVYQTVAAGRGFGAQVRNIADQVKNMADQLAVQQDALKLAREGQEFEFKTAVYQAYQRVLTEVSPLVDEWTNELERLGIITDEDWHNCGSGFEGRMFLLQAKFKGKDARSRDSVLRRFINQPRTQRSFEYFLHATKSFKEFCGSFETTESVRHVYRTMHFDELCSALEGLCFNAVVPRQAANDARGVWKRRGRV